MGQYSNFIILIRKEALEKVAFEQETNEINLVSDGPTVNMSICVFENEALAICSVDRLLAHRQKGLGSILSQGQVPALQARFWPGHVQKATN